MSIYDLSKKSPYSTIRRWNFHLSTLQTNHNPQFFSKSNHTNQKPYQNFTFWIKDQAHYHQIWQQIPPFNLTIRVLDIFIDQSHRNLHRFFSIRIFRLKMYFYKYSYFVIVALIFTILFQSSSSPTSSSPKPSVSKSSSSSLSPASKSATLNSLHALSSLGNNQSITTSDFRFTLFPTSRVKINGRFRFMIHSICLGFTPPMLDRRATMCSIDVRGR